MRRRAAPFLLVSVLVFGSAALAASTADGDEVLPVMVQVPYGFLFLHLPAFSSTLPPTHGWSFEVGTTVTNNFIYSDNFGTYLAARSSRQPMSMVDVDAVAAANPGEDYYYFDGEVTTVHAMVATSVTRDFAIGARISAVGISGGAGMDGFVEGFHDTFGLGQSYRDAVTRGDITSALRIDGQSEALVDYDREGMGDPFLYLQWSPDRGHDGWRTSVGAGVKIPVASTSKRLSTGRADIGVALAVTGNVGRWCVNVNGGVVFPGNVSFLPDLTTAPIVGVSGAAGYKFRSTSLWVLLQWEQSPLRDATQTPLSDDVHDLSIGFRFPLGGKVRGYVAVTENILAFDNSSDIGFHGGLTWTAGGK